jgi:hypothetical protein
LNPRILDHFLSTDWEKNRKFFIDHINLKGEIIMGEKALLERIEKLENQIRQLQDIEDIKNLQKAYGYYIEHWMAPEIIDLFADGPDVALTLAAGTYLGKEGVKRYFERHDNNNPEFLHQVMQLSGIITVDPDGKRAKGRWYGFGAVAIPGDNGIREAFMGGIYMGEYIKEDNIWKFEKLRFDQIYTGAPAVGWVAPERVAKAKLLSNLTFLEADIPRTVSAKYPSGYICPFHYKHPVTGKETSEGIRNSNIKKATEGLKTD